jgi:hypothetical protein
VTFLTERDSASFHSPLKYQCRNLPTAAWRLLFPVGFAIHEATGTILDCFYHVVACVLGEIGFCLFQECQEWIIQSNMSGSILGNSADTSAISHNEIRIDFISDEHCIYLSRKDTKGPGGRICYSHGCVISEAWLAQTKGGMITPGGLIAPPLLRLSKHRYPCRLHRLHAFMIVGSNLALLYRRRRIR